MKNTILGIIIGFTLALVLQPPKSEAKLPKPIYTSCSPAPTITPSENLNNML